MQSGSCILEAAGLIDTTCEADMLALLKRQGAPVDGLDLLRLSPAYLYQRQYDESSRTIKFSWKPK